MMISPHFLAAIGRLVRPSITKLPRVLGYLGGAGVLNYMNQSKDGMIWSCIRKTRGEVMRDGDVPQGIDDMIYMVVNLVRYQSLGGIEGLYIYWYL